MLAHLLVAGAAFSASVHGLQASQQHHHRPSLNYGSNTPRRVTASIIDDDLDAASSTLIAFNAGSAFKTSGKGSRKGDGASIAQAFVEQLHPQQQFRLQSGVKSAGESVFHAYFVRSLLAVVA